MKAAGRTSGRLVSTERWRIQVAARKVARAQNQGSPETARSAAEPASDRVELFGRLGDCMFAALSREAVFATAIVTTCFERSCCWTVCNAGHPRPLLYRVGQRQWDLLSHHELPPIPFLETYRWGSWT